jgi:hypothetical protein
MEGERRFGKNWATWLAGTTTFIALAYCTAVAQDPPNTITFSNNSGESATVKLVGPAHGYVPVPNQSERTVHVAGDCRPPSNRIYPSDDSPYYCPKPGSPRPFFIESPVPGGYDVESTALSENGGNRRLGVDHL